MLHPYEWTVPNDTKEQNYLYIQQQGWVSNVNEASLMRAHIAWVHLDDILEAEKP